MPEVDRGPGLGEVAAYRPWFRQNVRPSNYSPAQHILLHLGPLVIAIAWAASRLRDVKPIEWLVVPTLLIASSYFVYWFHRFVLHRPKRWAHFAYVRHTLQHHRFYDYEHITPDEPEDLYVTLFPWWSGVVLCVVAFGLSLGLAPLLGSNVAHLTMVMMPAYLLLYELVHSMCHLPDENSLTRWPLLSFLREHHRIHHDPALMAKHNFNIVIPLFDWMLGALLTKRPQGNSSPGE